MGVIKKNTNDLLCELTRSDSLVEFIKHNDGNFLEEDLAKSLDEILKSKGLSKSGVLKRAEINDIYGYQIFSGSRRPSRDKLLSLCLGMELTLDETQSLLKSSGFPALYPKIKRDSIIISCICSQKSVFDTNGLLYEYGQKLL